MSVYIVSYKITLIRMAERKGLEPSASDVTGRRYNRLNYRSAYIHEHMFVRRFLLHGTGGAVNKKNTFK